MSTRAYDSGPIPCGTIQRRMGYYDVSVLPPIGMHRTSALRIAWRRQDGSEAYPMVLTGDEIDTIVHAIDVIRDLNS